MKEKVLKQFEENALLYKRFGEKFTEILTDLLQEEGIMIHNITSRVKTKESLSKKIDDKKSNNNNIDKYHDLSDITDICGVRVITYLDSDVNKVADVIEKQFDIDKDNSVDKRKLKTDQFGYKSLHYVVSLDKGRLDPAENRKFKNCKLEIQVRTILQHAWAEIEHDLGYKNEVSVPEELKRAFNRLSALLETADIEFDRLKKDLTKYEVDVKKEIVAKPDKVALDQASIAAFAATNKELNQAADIIQKYTGCTFDDSGTWDRILRALEFLNIESVGELNNLLESNKAHFFAFTKAFIADIEEMKHTRTLSKKTAVFYFLHFLAASHQDLKYMYDYFELNNFSTESKRSPQYFIDLYNKTK